MIGVYKITNTVDGKVYIGSTAVDIEWRWSTHKSRLRKGKHYNRHLQRAWNKYGESAFSFEVVEELSDKNEIREKEVGWIARFFGKNCYNATKNFAGYPSGKKRKKTAKQKDDVITLRGDERKAAMVLAAMNGTSVSEWFKSIIREKGKRS